MYDVIVIGAGPAGSVTARTVAEAGYDVLIIEKNSTCRSPCAGYISKTINIELPDAIVIQSSINKMRTYFPDMSFHDFDLNGCVVNRQLFDLHLLSKATELGAEVCWNSPVVDICSANPNNQVSQEDKISPLNVIFRTGLVSGKIIVGADGVFSKTASIIGLERQRFAACAQYYIEGIEIILQTCEIFFDAFHAPGGFIWLYPSGEESAKIGLGMINHNKSPRENLDAFITGSKIAHRIYGKKSGYISGALPIGGLREKLVFENILLTGDSAGMADPVTGAGINNAILAGELAGNAIITALENDDISKLLKYETGIKKLIGRPLGRALEKRKQLEACCNNILLQKHLPELWVAFKQYLE